MMKEYRCKKTCYWGPQPGSESMYQRDDIIFATGSERQLDEFFEPVAIDPPEDLGNGVAIDPPEDLGNGVAIDPPEDPGNGGEDDQPGDTEEVKIPNRRKRDAAGAE